MTVEKRIKLKCWHCGREYTLYKELDVEEKPKLVVQCPFCEREGVVDLAPWRSELMDVYKGFEPDAPSVGETLDLPDVLPTREREE